MSVIELDLNEGFRAFEKECRTPILTAIDLGMTGVIVQNDSEGMLHCHKMPVDDTKGVDLGRVMEIIEPSEFVLIERQRPGGMGKHFKVPATENSIFAQYKEFYGLLTGMRKDFYAIRPEAWMRFLGFPSRKSVGEDVWKDFLHAQALQRFPNRKIPKYAADGYLLMEVLRQLQSKPVEQWP